MNNFIPKSFVLKPAIMSNNTAASNSSDTQQPTINDIFNLLKNCATKEDLCDMTNQVKGFATETNEKIEALTSRVDSTDTIVSQNTDRIEMLEANVECLKQEQLKNNLCISGVPPELVSNNNSANAVTAIAKSLGIDITPQHFTSYTVASNKFIIAHIFNIKYKQMMMNKIRVKKSLMVEEVFNHKSNSQIYLNDHLTPYFSSLFLMARNAKKEGKIASASSYGGKVRARKSASDAPITITTERQLRALIDMDCDTNSDSDMSVQLIGSDIENNNVSPTTAQKKEKNKERGNNNNRGSKRTNTRSNNYDKQRDYSQRRTGANVAEKTSNKRRNEIDTNNNKAKKSK